MFHEIKLFPEQEIQKDRFTVERDFTRKINAVIFPDLCEGYELRNSVISSDPELFRDPAFEIRAKISLYDAYEFLNCMVEV